MKTSHFLLAAGISLALVFTFSCTSDENSNGSGGSSVTGGADGGGNQFSQIYNEDGTAYKGSGFIKIRAYDDESGGENLINAGSVTNGIVKLELPENIPDKYLIDFFNEKFNTRFCSDYPEDIKIFKNFSFVLTTNDNEDYIDELLISYRDEQAREDIMYRYLTKTGKITCNYVFDDGYVSKSNLDVKAGWNKAYCRSNNTSDECSTKNILTKEMKWIIRTYK
jgi:hypothetical protein